MLPAAAAETRPVVHVELPRIDPTHAQAAADRSGPTLTSVVERAST